MVCKEKAIDVGVVLLVFFAIDVAPFEQRITENVLEIHVSFRFEIRRP